MCVWVSVCSMEITSARCTRCCVIFYPFFILNAGKTKRERKKSSAKMELCWEEIGTRKLTAEWIVKYGGRTRGKVGGGDCARWDMARGRNWHRPCHVSYTDCKRNYGTLVQFCTLVEVLDSFSEDPTRRWVGAFVEKFKARKWFSLLNGISS